MSQQPTQVHQRETLEDALNRFDATKNGQSLPMKRLQNKQTELDNAKRDYETKKSAIETEKQIRLNKIDGRREKIRRRSVICMMCIYIVLFLTAIVIASLGGLPELTAYYTESGEPGAFVECLVVMLIFFGPLLIFGIYIGLHSLGYSPIFPLFVYIASPIWTLICSCFVADDHSSPDTIEFTWNIALLPVVVALGVLIVAIIVSFLVNVFTKKGTKSAENANARELAILKKDYERISNQLQNECDILQSEAKHAENKSRIPAHFYFEGSSVSNTPQDPVHELRVFRRVITLRDEMRAMANDGVKTLGQLKNRQNELKKQLASYSSDKGSYKDALEKQILKLISVKASKKLRPLFVFLTLITIASFIHPATIVIPLALDHGQYVGYFFFMLLTHIIIAFCAIAQDKVEDSDIETLKKPEKTEGEQENKSPKKSEEYDSFIGSCVGIAVAGFIYYGCNWMFFGKWVFLYSLTPFVIFILFGLLKIAFKKKLSERIRANSHSFMEIREQAIKKVSKTFNRMSIDTEEELSDVVEKVESEEERASVSQENLIVIQKALDSVGSLPYFYQGSDILDKVIDLADKNRCTTINEALILYERTRIVQLERDCESCQQGVQKALDDIKYYEKYNNVYDSLKEHERKVKAGNFQSQYEGYCYKYDSLQKELDNLARSKGIDSDEL